MKDRELNENPKTCLGFSHRGASPCSRCLSDVSQRITSCDRVCAWDVLSGLPIALKGNAAFADTTLTIMRGQEPENIFIDTDWHPSRSEAKYLVLELLRRYGDPVNTVRLIVNMKYCFIIV